MREKAHIIAIDGPAGSGKSTVAKEVARALGYLYIDTGAMYRALTLKALRQNLDLGDKGVLIQLSVDTGIELHGNYDSQKVFLDGEDVTGKIRDLSVSEKVRYLARIDGVRENMVKIQREMGQRSKGAVLEGRDIGTVVFPDAKYKFYLDASFDERVSRRLKQLTEKGKMVSMEEVSLNLKERDHSDMTRKVGPLKKADDAICVDTTDLSIKQVIEYILERV